VGEVYCFVLAALWTGLVKFAQSSVGLLVFVVVEIYANNLCKIVRVCDMFAVVAANAITIELAGGNLLERQCKLSCS
jgi:hypothetical protein